MIKKLQKIFALTEQGAKDLVRAFLWTVVANMSLMFPMCITVLVISHIVESLMNGTNVIENIGMYVGASALIIVFIFIVHILQYNALYTATYKESANRRIRLGEKLRKLPLAFFGQRDLSDLTTTLMADSSFLEQAFSHFIPQTIGTTISTTLIAIGLIGMDWRMGIAVLWVVPVSLLIIFASHKMQDKFSKVTLLAKRQVADGFQELLETVKDIKACNYKEKYMNKLENQLKVAEKAEIRSELVTGTAVTSAQSILKIGVATTLLVGINLLIEGNISLTTLLIFMIVATRIYDPISIAYQNMAAMFSAQIKINRMKEIEEIQEQAGTSSYHIDNYDIVFDNVKFAYNKDEGVLNGISFTAKQGNVTALVGPSGGGKSTAAKLAARFWDIDGGKITLGGMDISKVEPEALLKNYSIVFQDVVLFKDTIMENIRLGRRDATDEEVIAAATAAQCDEFIKRLPEGYHTMIGENGSTLSGGERQRISIARALLKDAPVILLDEATASLDVENETKIQEAISKLVKGKTVLIIAHRMRTVAKADHIVVLKDGKVAEQGTPDELWNQNGIYRHMADLQTMNQNWVLEK